MKVFVLDKVSYSTGPLVDGIEKMVWVERYNQPGEFTIIGDPARLMNTMPVSSFISHENAEEVMIVESLYIDESTGQSPKVVAKGRSVSAYIMENRVISFGWPTGGGAYPADLWLKADIPNFSEYPMHYIWKDTWVHSWFAVETLLRECLLWSTQYETIENLQIWDYNLIYDEDVIYGQYVTKKLEYLSSFVYEVLRKSDTGLKVCRPGAERKYLEQYIIDAHYTPPPEEGVPDFSDQLFFIVYKGIDRRDSVMFNINNGDIANARYLWTTKDQKNGYYVGNLSHTVRQFGSTGWDSKIASISADDWNEDADYTNEEIISFLKNRAERVILDKNRPGAQILLEVTGSKNAGPRYKFHYGIGDIVSVFGNYGVNEAMRVFEVATIQDGVNEEIVPTLKPAFNNDITIEA